MRADNFSEEDLPELMSFLHRHGVKGFVAMNTLVFPGELEGAVEQVEIMGRAGVDAVIVQDLGLAKLMHEIAPEMELHASTQMTITSAEGLNFVNAVVPLKRAVLARELSVAEIAKVKKASDVALEVFVHGALCVAYSGQCLTSESLGQRSANRGECAQACRMPYELVVDGETVPMGEVRYLLSPQDLAAVEMIPELLEAGVKSYKIEGRLKTPEYVAAVTRVYREALDRALSGGMERAEEEVQKDRYELEMMFSRGLSTGWLGGTNHPLLTHGKWGKKRGAFAGKISEIGDEWVELTDVEVPLHNGDGFVFDAGEDRDREQGGTVWRVEGTRLTFDRRSNIDWSRVRVGMGVWKTRDPQLESDARKSWKGRLEERGEGLEIQVLGREGEPMVLACQGKRVESEIVLVAAEKRPLSTELLEKQLGRLGGTGYALSSVRNELEGELMLPVSALNRLRRALVDALDQAGEPTVLEGGAVLNQHMPRAGEGSVESTSQGDGPSLRVLCRGMAQVRGCLQAGVEEVYADFEDVRLYKEAVAEVQAAGKRIVLATPRVQKPGEAGYFKLIARAEPDAVLIRNLGASEYFRAADVPRVGDFSLNVSNAVTARLLREAGGFERLTISYDLNMHQVLRLLRDAPPRWFELTLHQHMPMFHMEHCVFCTFMSEGTTSKDCGRPCEKHKVQLRDRVGQLHVLSADVGCRNTLFNGRAQTGAGGFLELRRAGLRDYRVELLQENEVATERVVTLYQQLLKGSISPNQLVDEVDALSQLGVTAGTLEKRRSEVHG